MSDHNRQLNLAEALRTLPLQAPERSAWPQLMAQLQNVQTQDRPAQRNERIRRFVIPAALAAALAAVFVLTYQPRGTHTQTSAATVVPGTASSNTNSAKVSNVHNAATDSGQLVTLQKRSQDLERWLRETGDAAVPLQGQDLVAATEIENLIGLVDVELSGPQQTQDANLWQRRVNLLEDLSALRYSNYQLAAGGRVIAASLTN
jgi:hypothetical protein